MLCPGSYSRKASGCKVWYFYAELTAQAEPYSKTKDPECTEMKTDLLEVFEDAIDDEKLLGSVEEKYDQGIMISSFFSVR